MNPATISTVILAALALMAAIGAGIGWFYRRGRDEQKLSNSVEKHAEATELLAAQVGGLRDVLEAHAATLTEHHFRLKALEDRQIQVTVK